MADLMRSWWPITPRQGTHGHERGKEKREVLLYLSRLELSPYNGPCQGYDIGEFKPPLRRRSLLIVSVYSCCLVGERNTGLLSRSATGGFGGGKNPIQLYTAEAACSLLSIRNCLS